MTHQRLYGDLEKLLKPSLHGDDLRTVRRSYEVASQAHSGQLRDEGTPYIIHPVRVARILAHELRVFHPTLISAALLHDVVEDTPVTNEDIIAEFGSDIGRLVMLLTRLVNQSHVDYLSAIVDSVDSGATLVKLCDRLDNLRFLSYARGVEKKQRYVWMTTRYYLPLAERTNQYLHVELSEALERARRDVNFPEVGW